MATNNRFRDGSYSNFNNTDLAGNAGFNEIFPLFSWYVIEDGLHALQEHRNPRRLRRGWSGRRYAVRNAVNPPTAPCGTSNIASNMANTAEADPCTLALRVPGARYCASADCPSWSIRAGGVHWPCRSSDSVWD